MEKKNINKCIYVLIFLLELDVYCIYLNIYNALTYNVITKDHTGNKPIRLCVFNALCNFSKHLAVECDFVILH